MMSKFKNLVFSALLSLGAFGAVTFTACTQDECKDVVCNNGGTCVSGDCVCATGYEGNNCETETRTRFVGTWNASDLLNGTSTTLVYTVAIAPGSNINSVIISKAFSEDFFNNNLTATVANSLTGGTTITIPDQRPDANGDFRVTGSGTFTNGRITWTYTLTEISSGRTQTYTGTWAK